MGRLSDGGVEVVGRRGGWQWGPSGRDSGTRLALALIVQGAVAGLPGTAGGTIRHLDIDRYNTNHTVKRADHIRPNSSGPARAGPFWAAHLAGHCGPTYSTNPPTPPRLPSPSPPSSTASFAGLASRPHAKP